MHELVASYIDALHHATMATRTAADRPKYQALLADAAVVLAGAVGGAAPGALRALVEAHERLRGHTWLEGDERGSAEQAWARVRVRALALPAT